MGTPGDKAEIRKVVQSQQLDSEQHIPSIIPSSSPSSTSLTSPGVSQLHQSSTSRTTTTTASVIRRSTASTTTTTEMGVINRWPLQQQLESVASSFQLPKSENFPTASTTSLSGLEQAHIEDYYTQTKYYPSSTESLQILYPALPQKQQQQQLQQQQQQEKTFRSLDEPGPSGLQTTSTPKKIGTRVGRTRKSSTITATTAAATTGTEEDFEQQQQQQPQKRVHTCSVCQKNFANIEKLTKHQQIHTGVSPFKCEHCKKTFTSKFKLVRHTLIHSDQKPFNCTVCERTFHRKDHLKNHIKVHSPSKKVYICEKSDCKKEYTSQMSFRKHQALHAAEEGSLQCQICLSIFKTKDDILYHLKVHAGSRTVKNPSEKKFTCDKCERKFFTKKDVRRHMVVHTGMRDFLCQFCPQRFGRKDHLVRHIKKSHSKNLPTGDLETAIKTEKTSDNRSNITTKPETIVKPIKTEVDIKTEFTETVTNPSAEFNFTLDLLPEETFDQLLQREFLPSTSTQADDDDDVSLKDLSDNLLFKSSTTTITKEEEEEEDQQEQQTEQQSQSFDETILHNISETTTIIEANLSDPGIISESVLNDPAIQRLLQPTEEKNLPLPGFSQTFQSPPPPPPP